MRTLLVVVLLLSLNAWGGLTGPVILEGVVKSFDEKTVVLMNDEGGTFTVERSRLEPKYKVVQGVRVVILEKALMTKPAEDKKKAP